MTLVSKIERILEWGSLKDIDLPEEIIGVKKEAEETIKSYRKQAIRTVIDSYRKDYPLLEKVIRGETTFEKEYKPLIDKYSGVISFFLPIWLTDKETKIPKENKGMIHDYNLSDRIRALEKPISWAGYGTTIAYTASTIAKLLHWCIPHINILTCVATGLGFLIGVGCSEGTYKHKNCLKKDLNLLDEQIREIYHES